MKQTLIILLTLISSVSFGQHVGVRYSPQSTGISMSVPLQLKGAINKGVVSAAFMQEGDRRLVYLHYTEKLDQFIKLNLIKNLHGFGGVGLHIGAREVLSYKKDAQTIFLAGATAVVGLKYNIKEVVYISADMMPRVDFPFFGGCDMHKHCGDMKIGSVNFSIGINLK